MYMLIIGIFTGNWPAYCCQIHVCLVCAPSEFSVVIAPLDVSSVPEMVFHVCVCVVVYSTFRGRGRERGTAPQKPGAEGSPGDSFLCHEQSSGWSQQSRPRWWEWQWANSRARKEAEEPQEGWLVLHSGLWWLSSPGLFIQKLRQIEQLKQQQSEGKELEANQVSVIVHCCGLPLFPPKRFIGYSHADIMCT